MMEGKLERAKGDGAPAPREERDSNLCVARGLRVHDVPDLTSSFSG